MKSLLWLACVVVVLGVGRGASAEDKKPLAVVVERTDRDLEGWRIRVDNRLLAAPHEALGVRCLKFLEHRLFEIKTVVPAERVKQLQTVKIVLDLDHGDLKPAQYHPSAGWLVAHGYAADLEKCVHLPRAADIPTSRNIREQPWMILHELAHAYHDQFLDFEEPRVKAAFDRYKAGGQGEKTLLHNGQRVKHYALTNHKEFFAEMTEAYFGVNDFFPFTRAELIESEPQLYELLKTIWSK